MLTNAELAILGLVLEQPRHGYAIETVIEERGMREWTEVGFSSIYYILNKLEEEGLIRSQLSESEGRGPARKVYAITEAGLEAWESGTVQALSEPGKPNSSFLLGMVGLPGIPVAEALAAFHRYRESLAERRDRLRVRRSEIQEEGAPLFLDGMFSYSMRMVETELNWVDEFIDQLQAHPEGALAIKRSRS